MGAVAWAPSNLGSGQCKTGFLAIPKIWHSMPFLAMTIWVIRPRPMHQMTRHQNNKSPIIQEKKKKLDLVPKSWRLAYLAHDRLQLTKLANRPSMGSIFGTKS